MNVYDVLFPPDKSNEFIGWVQFATLTKDKKMISLGYSDFKNIKEKAENLKINKTQDYYIMANTVKKYTNRKSENLFSLNNIVLDFDTHNPRLPSYERELLIDEFVWRLKRDLVTTNELPCPSVIHYTGRGVQIYWHLESVSSKLLFLYQRAIEYFIVIIREFLKEYPTLQRCIEIDSNASKNAVGLYRMFDTYNTRAKTMTVTEILHDKALNLNCLVKQLEQESEPVKVYLKRKRTIKKRYKEQELNNDIITEEKRNSYSALHYKRIKIIEELANDSDCIGKRDMMLFLAFNSARQIYSFETAKKICRKINRSFSEPLKNIDYIFKQEKVYHIKNSTFFEKLGVTEESLINMGKYEMSRPNITRDLERQTRKLEQDMKKDVAKKLLTAGKKHKFIAEQTGLSLSTISRLSSTIKHKRR